MTCTTRANRGWAAHRGRDGAAVGGRVQRCLDGVVAKRVVDELFTGSGHDADVRPRRAATRSGIAPNAGVRGQPLHGIDRGPAAPVGLLVYLLPPATSARRLPVSFLDLLGGG
jgi:hypothetical protein